MTSSIDSYKLIYITDNTEVSAMAIRAGVDMIMVDLEILGKVERQGHLDSVISRHSPEVINRIADKLSEIGAGELLVRLNPLHGDSAAEVQDAILRGAQRLMLPMFRTADEVKKFLEIVDYRVPVTLLLETKDAYTNLDDILNLNGHFDIHIGLNDLHIDMKLDFMFELLINGVVDDIASKCKTTGRPFGIGGIAPLSLNAMLPPASILAYHTLVGSTCVILNRGWRQFENDETVYTAEVEAIRMFLTQKPILDVRVLVEAVLKAVEKIKKTNK